MLMKYNSYIIITGMAITVCLFFSCRRGLPPAQYLNWFNVENEVICQTVENGQMSYRLSFRSPETFALAEMKTDEYSIKRYNDLMEEYNGHLYFLLELSDTTKQADLLAKNIKPDLSPHDFTSRIFYLSAEIKDDLELITSDNDTLVCEFSHFERNYKLSPHLRVMLGFEKPEKETFEIKKIRFYDRAFSQEIIEFNFKLNYPKSLPKLKI
jgi:hypothetical protein